jgi:hypothetical protein
MSISNCSAYSASATTAPITGAVSQKDPKPSEVLPVTPVKTAQPVAADKDQKGPAPAASLSSDTLSALLSFAG